MNTFSIICCLIIIACGVGIIAETIVDAVLYYIKHYVDEEEES